MRELGRLAYTRNSRHFCPIRPPRLGRLMTLLWGLLLIGPRGTGKVTWQPNVFTDGAMSQIARWAPWSRMAAFATWTPGRTLESCPRTPDEEDFLFHQWKLDGLMQWNIVIGCHQTSSRAEDFGALAALLAPHPVTAAIDNASTASFLQQNQLPLQRDHCRGPRTNADVRKVIYELLKNRGPESSLAFKTKAHTSEEQLREGLVTSPFLREGNSEADSGAKRALLEHNPQLNALGKQLAQRDGSTSGSYLSSPSSLSGWQGRLRPPFKKPS